MKYKYKYEKAIIAIAVLTFIFSAGISSVQAQTDKILDDNLDDEYRTEQLLGSFEDSDYDNWLKFVNPNSNLAKKISKEDFELFMQARKLARQGKYEDTLHLYHDLKTHLKLSNIDVDIVEKTLHIE